MLAQLVEQVCAEIEGLELFGQNLAVLQDQLSRNAGDTIRKMVRASRKAGSKATNDGTAMILALSVTAMLSGLPALARRLLASLKKKRIPVGRRCGVAGVLAYLVQPHDLIPDSAPGGYGYIDDLVLLRAGMVEYLELFPDPKQDVAAEERRIRFLVGLTPRVVRPALQTTVSAMSMAIQVLAALDDETAELVLAQIVADPIAATTQAPEPPAEFTPRPARDYTRRASGGGPYTGGGNIIFPGGPAIVNGQLIVP